MSLAKNILTIWKNKGLILEGVMNSIFKKEDVEEIAAHRLEICKTCDLYDTSGKGCLVPGTQPCCNEEKGGCGCSLTFKTRSLSSKCPHPEAPKWDAILSEEEEDKLNEKLGL
jgi:hypothetical protein